MSKVYHVMPYDASLDLMRIVIVGIEFLKSEVDCVIAKPGAANARIAMFSLVNAMIRKRYVAVARYVGRKRSFRARLVRLSPGYTNGAPCLYMTDLACMHDYRDFEFPTLDNETQRPTQAQVDVMKRFIKSFTLDDEDFKPETTANPTRQSFYETIHQRALNANYKPSSERNPPLVPTEEKLNDVKGVMETLKSLFPVHLPSPTKTKEFWGSYYDQIKNVSSAQLFEEKTSKYTTRDINAGPESWFNEEKTLVNEVGNVHPVEDFWAMVDRQDKDLFQAASNGMITHIMGFLGPLGGENYYDKALSCIRALRNGCVKTSNGTVFNNFLRNLKQDLLLKHNNSEFWNSRLVGNSISLVVEDEDMNVSVSQKEAAAFLESKPKAEAPSKSMNLFTEDDDLSDMD